MFHSGITEPIKSGIRDRRLGLGKQEEDDYFTAEENIQRRKLDIEIEETEEIAKKREVCALKTKRAQGSFLLPGWWVSSTARFVSVMTNPGPSRT